MGFTITLIWLTLPLEYRWIRLGKIPWAYRWFLHFSTTGFHRSMTLWYRRSPRCLYVLILSGLHVLVQVRINIKFRNSTHASVSFGVNFNHCPIICIESSSGPGGLPREFSPSEAIRYLRKRARQVIRRRYISIGDHDDLMIVRICGTYLGTLVMIDT